MIDCSVGPLNQYTLYFVASRIVNMFHTRTHGHGGTTEEGNCTYLLPLPHREDSKEQTLTVDEHEIGWQIDESIN